MSDMNSMPMATPMGAAPSKVGPSIWWVVLALLVAVAGPVGCMGSLAVQSLNVVNNVATYGQFDVDTTANVQFDAAEPEGSVMAVIPRDTATTNVSVSLTGPNGESVSMEPTGVTNSVEFPDGSRTRRLRQLYSFKVSTPGTYTLVSETGGENEATEIWLGQGGFTSIGQRVLPAMGGATVALFVGLIAAIVIGRRRKANRIALGASGGFPPPGQYSPQPGQYPQQAPQYPPQPGQYPQQAPQYPPQAPQQPGQYPQQAPQYPPQPGQYPSQAGQYPPQPGQSAQPEHGSVPPSPPGGGVVQWSPLPGEPTAAGTDTSASPDGAVPAEPISPNVPGTEGSTGAEPPASEDPTWPSSPPPQPPA